MSLNQGRKILTKNQVHYNNALDLLNIVSNYSYNKQIRSAADRVADYLLNGR